MAATNGNLDYFVGKRVEYTADYSRRLAGECVGWTVDQHGHGYLVVTLPGIGTKTWMVSSCVVCPSS